jgi:hypothetical protein
VIFLLLPPWASKFQVWSGEWAWKTSTSLLITLSRQNPAVIIQDGFEPSNRSGSRETLETGSHMETIDLIWRSVNPTLCGKLIAAQQKP